MLFREILVPITSIRPDLSFFEKISKITNNIETIITLYFSTEDPRDILQASSMGFVSGMEGEFISRQQAEDDKIWQNILDICQKFPNFRAERVVGKVFDTLISRASITDLIMIDGEHMAQNRANYKNAEIALMDSRVTGMILGKHAHAEAKNIAIAWNGSPQAARAVKASLPFLAKADKVSILQLVKKSDARKTGIFNPEVLVNTLKRHDINAEIVYDQQKTNDVAHDLLEMARGIGADTIVAGLYSTSRATEVLFGGTSKTLMKNVGDLNLILSH